MDNASLIIKTKIFNKETFELIEYESSNFMKTKIIIKTSGTLCRKKKEYEINFYNHYEENPNNIELLKINRNNDNGYYSINAGNYSPDLKVLIEQEPAFLVYRGNQNTNESPITNYKKIYKLSQGDIIKLGRVYVKVIDIVLKNKTNQKYNKNKSGKSCLLKSSTVKQMTHRKKIDKISLNNSHNNNITIQRSKMHSSIDLFFGKNILDSPQNINLIDEENDKISHGLILMNKDKNNIQKTKKKIKKICRICYGEEEDEENNPLLCPCTCKGSMKYIHYKCLKNWLNSKIENSKRQFFDSENCITYFQQDLSCELCKTIFPDFIRYKNKLLNITLYNSKFEQYIIFESMKVNKFKKKLIHILSLDKFKYFTLGRARECDIIFPELSVSRYHCYIFKDENNEIYVEDNHSKFGTLALIQNPNINMLYKESLNIQKERTFIKIDLNIPFKIFPCCNVNIKEQKIKPYEIQNKQFLNVDSCFVIKDNIDIETEEENNSEVMEKTNDFIEIINDYDKNTEKNTKRSSEKEIGKSFVKIVKIRNIHNNNEHIINKKNKVNNSNDITSIKLHKINIKNESSEKKEKQTNCEDVSKRFRSKSISSRSSLANIHNKKETNRLNHLARVSSFLFRNGQDSDNKSKKIKLKKQNFLKNGKNHK